MRMILAPKEAMISSSYAELLYRRRTNVCAVLGSQISKLGLRRLVEPLKENDIKEAV